MPATGIRRLQRLSQSLLFDPSYYWHAALLVLLGDAFLTQLIIRFVRCQSPLVLFATTGTRNERAPTDTEIDWETYMYHIELYLRGERNYSLIDGPTGLLV